MKDVLDTVDHRWPVRALEDVHEPFEPKEVGTAMFGNRLEKKRQRDRPYGLSAHDGVGVDIMRVVRVLTRRGLRPEPRLEIERLGERIVEPATKHTFHIEQAVSGS